MKHKSEAFEKFKKFKNEVKKQSDKPIKVLRSDQDNEYLSRKFLRYFKDNGIVSQWTPGTLQLNKISERRNRILLDMIRSLMSFTDLSLFLWGHTLLTIMIYLFLPHHIRYGMVRSQV